MAVNRMSEQQTPDREKKIAEIKDFCSKDYSIVPARRARGWCEFLLSEIEHLEREYAEERAAHNAHVTELCELEKENRKLRVLEKENRKLRVENRHLREDVVRENNKLREQFQSAQQEIERLGNLARQERELADHWMRKHHDDVVKLQEERDKLIEGLKYAHRFAKRDDLYDFDYVDGILKEIG